MQNVIIICGLNGVGKSTLGRALAEKMGYTFMDIEDVYFPKDDPHYLYAHPRTQQEVEDILAQTFRQDKTFVLAYVRAHVRQEILDHIRCAVYLTVPREVRLERVYQRSFQKFGDRMLPGGDLHEQEMAFLELVKARDESLVEDWLRTLSCPILRLDGTQPVQENVQLLSQQLQAIQK